MKKEQINNKTLKAKYLTLFAYDGDPAPKRIYGEVIADNNNFFVFKTGKGKEYVVNKNGQSYWLQETEKELVRSWA